MTIPYQTTSRLNAQALRPMARIINSVSIASKVSIDDILGKQRTKDIAKARIIAMALCRLHTKASLHQIGRVFRRDHTCVLNAVKRVDAITTPQDRNDMEDIARRCGLVKAGDAT